MSNTSQPTAKKYLVQDGAVYWPITAVDAVEGLTGTFLYQKVQSLIQWSDIAGKPSLYTSNEVDLAIAKAVAKLPVTGSPYQMITDQTALQNLANMGGD